LKRYSGIDRYATSALAATGAYATGGNHVVLVSGENYADGLAAAGLAGALAAPVLLTHPTTLLGSTANAIGTIDTGSASATTALKVTIVGGVNAVSAGVATSLTGLGYTVERISGDNRYSTATAVGDKIRATTTIGSIVSKTTAILVAGNNFADGLAAGGMSYLNKSPILLTDGSSLSAGTKTFLDSEVNPVAQVLIVGGTAAVSAAVATEVAAIKNGLVAINVMRVSGADRYATALELAKFRAKAAVLQGNAETVTNIMLVSGENFADALSSAAKAGAAATMTLLSTTSAMDAASSTWIASKYASITNVFVTGGTSAISTAVATGAKTGATTVKVTATSNVGPGVTCIAITYNALMTAGSGTVSQNGGSAPAEGTGAGDTRNYKLNNTMLAKDGAAAAANDDVVCGVSQDRPAAGKAGAITCADNATAGTTKCSFLLGTALAVGDVLKIGATDTPSSVVGARAATGSFTVVAEAVVPKVASFDPIQVGGTEVTFTMSEAVQWSATAGDSANILTHDDIACGSDAVIDSMAHVSGNTFIGVIAGADPLAAGETCTITAAYKDVAGNAATVNGVSAAAVTDTTGSIVQAKLMKTVHTGGVTAALGTTGTFKVAAKVGGAYQGPAGDSWTVQGVAGASTALPTLSVYDPVNKVMVISACYASCATGKQATAQNIVDMLNAHSDFSPNFLATVHAAGNAAAVWAAGALTTGSTVYDIVVTSNEIMGETAADWRVEEFTGDADGAGTGTAGCTMSQDTADTTATPVASDWYQAKMHMTCTANAVNELMTVGSSYVLAGANVKDFKGNVMTAAARKIVLQAG
jgi:putative cell wall-binding protein